MGHIYQLFNEYMKQFLETLQFDVRKPFKNHKYTFLFVALFFVFFALFVFVPIWTVPGNTPATQFETFTFRDYAVLILLSSLSSLFITMRDETT